MDEGNGPEAWISESPDPFAWEMELARWTAQPDANGCNAWTGIIDRHGYGCFRWRENGRQRRTSAARATWLALRGPIPPGCVPDHLCRNRACVNPDHLEIVTAAENTRRGLSMVRGRNIGRRPRVVSPNFPCGHERNDENTRVTVTRQTGYINRTCRTCNRERCAAYKRSRRERAV